MQYRYIFDNQQRIVHFFTECWYPETEFQKYPPIT